MLREVNPSTQEAYHDVMQALLAKREIGFGKIGMPLRVSLLGSMTGAGMDEVMALLGVDETVERIERAIEAIVS
jgi:glutamyl-tRNA synthetase